METITPIPVTLHKFTYYVKCPNRGNGNGKLHLGRTVKKCKVGCNSFRGFIDHQVLCAWSAKQT
jgi:hypothetical protein